MSGSGVARRCSPISSPVPGRWPVVGGRVSARRCRGPVIAAGDAGTPRPATAGARRRSDTGRRPATPRRGAGRVPAASRTTPPLGSRPVPGRSPPAPQAPSSGRSRRSFPPGWQGSCSPSQTSVDRRAQRAGDAMMADDPATLVGDTRWCCNRDLPPEPRPAGWRRHAASTAQRGSLVSAASPAEPAAARPAASPPTRRSSRARRRRSRQLLAVSVTVGQRSVHDFWNPQAGNRIEWSGSAGSEGVLDLGRGRAVGQQRVVQAGDRALGRFGPTAPQASVTTTGSSPRSAA